MADWLSPAEILPFAQPELPGTVRGINRAAERGRWRLGEKARKRPGRGGEWEYHVSLLPAPVQARIRLAQAPARDEAKRATPQWAAFEAASKGQKDEADRRLRAVRAVEDAVKGGAGETRAIAAVCRDFDVARATLFNWRAAVRGLARADWLPALLPQHKGRQEHAAVHPDFWAALKADYLRPEKPGFSPCYRRAAALAKKHGWEPVPSERSLRRRMEAEAPRAVQVMAREGRDRAKTLYPAQKRDRSHFHAMQAVNMDGHRFDVFCRWPDGRIGRPHMLALQDLQSGKVVAWRLSDSENKETVRLVIGDMVERFGIPDKIFLDNGRAFASKWISGGVANRFRFKVRDEDPQGLLTSLGVEIVWTTPYNGQSKPIERAFRDIAEEVARHPACAGAYTGNRPDAKPENYGSKAVAIATFRELVADRIAAHNAQPGRTAANCAGRSFDETFAASYADAIVRRASAAQRALWLLAAEAVRAKKGSGEIELFGNRYWAAALNAHAGERVTVRFDPDRLDQPVKVYDRADRLICEAERIEAAGFDDATAAREHNRKRKAFLKAVSEQKRLVEEMSVEELARLAKPEPAPEPESPAQPAAVRLMTGTDGPARAEWDQQKERDFSAGLRVIAGGLGD